MDSMVELLELYKEEDEAYGGVLDSSTQLYQYLLQPFRDMRELAMLRRQQIKVTYQLNLLTLTVVFNRSISHQSTIKYLLEILSSVRHLNGTWLEHTQCEIWYFCL